MSMQLSNLTRMIQGTANRSAASGPASRRSFLRKSSILAVAAGSAALLGRNGNVARGDAVDEELLNFQFRSIEDHENAHVAFLVNALGTHARPIPTFHNLTMATMADFVDTSQALENTGVGAYQPISWSRCRPTSGRWRPPLSPTKMPAAHLSQRGPSNCWEKFSKFRQSATALQERGLLPPLRRVFAVSM